MFQLKKVHSLKSGFKVLKSEVQPPVQNSTFVD